MEGPLTDKRITLHSMHCALLENKTRHKKELTSENGTGEVVLYS